MTPEQQQAAETLAAPKRKGALLTMPPTGDARVEVLLAWMGSNLRLPAAIERVERWGSSAASPVVLKLSDGRKIRFAEASDLNNPARLVQTIVLALGAAAPQLPLFTKPDAQDVFSVAIRACTIVEHNDEVEAARDWQDSLSRVTRELHHGDYDNPEARWAGLTWLRNEPDFDARAQHHAFMDERYRLPVLVWANGSKYLRVDDVVRYIRGVLDERLATQQVVARMLEAGWQHARAEARRPGAGRARTEEDRVRVSVFIVAASANATETDVSPRSPNTSPAHPPARARSTAWASLGTPAETPMPAGSAEVGDTKELGDTSRQAVERNGDTVDLTTWAKHYAANATPASADLAAGRPNLGSPNGGPR